MNSKYKPHTSTTNRILQAKVKQRIDEAGLYQTANLSRHLMEKRKDPKVAKIKEAPVHRIRTVYKNLRKKISFNNLQTKNICPIMRSKKIYHQIPSKKNLSTRRHSHNVKYLSLELHQKY